MITASFKPTKRQLLLIRNGLDVNPANPRKHLRQESIDLSAEAERLLEFAGKNAGQRLRAKQYRQTVSDINELLKQPEDFWKNVKQLFQ